MLPDPSAMTAAEALPLLRSGELSVEALARACLARVAARDHLVRAWVHVDPMQVLAAARELDRAGPKGPLHGLPIGVKDIILTRDMPTQYNSPIFAGSRPAIDAACITTLRAAGALVFGKTDTVEFAATGRRALTRNPHNLACTPGGSSSGSAAAVADLHAPLALGTQTGGSMIRPASYCGTWAIKPSWGSVSREGVRPYAPTLDTLGWYGRSAADLSLLLDVLDPEPAAAHALDLTAARIAICRSPSWDWAEPATREAMELAMRKLADAGAQVELLELPPAFDMLPGLQTLIMRAEGRAAFLAEYRTQPDLLHPALREQVENTDKLSRSQLLDAYDHAAACRPAFDRLAAGYDAVLTPSTTGSAPVGLVFTGDPIFNGMWTLLHVPCVNIPGLTDAQGLPIGLTVTGPRFADRQVLAAGEAIGRLFSA